MAGRFQSPGGVLMLSVVAAVVLVILAQEASAQLCPLCECPAAFEPVCGKTVDKDGKVKLRGFPSRCYMECNNQCRKAQFQFVKRGRCGGKKPVRDPAHNSVLQKAASNSTTTPPTLKGLPITTK
ncbi:uncharacterized protein [Hetaerina americana]|uniref:uncharacterized protein n=1 Tax=Hetaerina americana TaxID=62018 RepID=UPI003A7F1DBD